VYPEPSTFELSVTSEGRWWTIHVRGELDGATAATVATAAQAVRDCGLSRVTFDLGAVTFVDIAGYRAVLNALTVIAERGTEVSISQQSVTFRRFDSLWRSAAPRGPGPVDAPPAIEPTHWVKSHHSSMGRSDRDCDRCKSAAIEVA
jgi:anti-anti-sigma factor